MLPIPGEAKTKQTGSPFPSEKRMWKFESNISFQMSGLLTFRFLLYSSGGELGNGNNVKTHYVFNGSGEKELASDVRVKKTNSAPWVFVREA